MTSEFDIPPRIFDFKADLDFGQQSEKEIELFLDDLSNGAFEVKTDRYRNGRMVVETDQNPRGVTDHEGNRIWKKSGINITTAKWWVYVFSPSQGFVIIDVQRLKRYLRANSERFNESTKRDFGGKDNPARGFLLMVEDVQDLLINKQYD
jgi:hypothetical protein